MSKLKFFITVVLLILLLLGCCGAEDPCDLSLSIGARALAPRVSSCVAKKSCTELTQVGDALSAPRVMPEEVGEARGLLQAGDTVATPCVTTGEAKEGRDTPWSPGARVREPSSDSVP
ncbi:hypothetical protein E2562_025999 [Oryza meyeriana var. granulata]|uniref:Ig-like domain-containing protein n=1 Tax=Oryza meyeriana var. granulata TaxID=110450 RepID=A0A6G1EPG3_9ORYZ|nr:hypothetical protein E2562_025999 [Oryza meyeriana var. granulata]